jgi:mono/diheme cytochrome c family protein
MPKALRWTFLAASGLLGTVAIAALVLYVVGGARLHRTYDVAVGPLEIVGDDAAIARGRHLAEAVTLCTACHGDDLSGSVLLDEPWIATIHASNLTRGLGGTGSTYGDADYVRAIRHGVNADGRGLMIMHSDAYNHLGAADLAAIIAYVKSVPAVNHETPQTRGGILGRIMLPLGVFDSGPMPLIPAERIDHSAPMVAPPDPGRMAEYGGYLVSIALCGMCHGSSLKGGPPVDVGAPPAPDITVYAVPGGWSEAQFVETIRSGTTPYGKALDPEFMPWEVYAKMTDDELAAIRAYMASLGG